MVLILCGLLALACNFTSVKQLWYDSGVISWLVRRASSWGAVLVVLLFAHQLVIAQKRIPGDTLPRAASTNWKTGLKPLLQFQARHARIGEPIYLSLSLWHGPDDDIIFPDSLDDYAPFEFLSKRYYATRTDARGSFDSAVYTLQTFHMKPEQVLRFKILKYTPQDTQVFYSNADTLYLHRLIPERPATPILKVNPALEYVPPAINYNYWALGLGLIVLALFLINTFLGRPIQKWFGLLVLYRRHTVFSSVFDKLSNQTVKGRSTDGMEQALNLWKQYMERVDQRPFSTYTTKEIATLLPDEHLVQALQSIDRAVYGGMQEEINERIFTILRRYAVVFYNKRREAIKNG